AVFEKVEPEVKKEAERQAASALIKQGALEEKLNSQQITLNTVKETLDKAAQSQRTRLLPGADRHGKGSPREGTAGGRSSARQANNKLAHRLVRQSQASVLGVVHRCALARIG